MNQIFTARKRSLGQDNIFRSMCQEFCPRGGACSRGGAARGGACSREDAYSKGVPASGGAWWRPPGQLLLWAVRILLECILVVHNFEIHSLVYFIYIYCLEFII